MRRKQKSMIQPLFLPVTPPLPHGLQRGGVFEHPGSPLTFADLAPQTVPTNSPVAHEVPQNVLRAPVTSVPTTDVRPISGFGQSLISADMQPLSIRPRMPVPVPQGATEGGIFGRGMVLWCCNVQIVLSDGGKGRSVWCSSLSGLWGMA
jgi:hypothetical protein